jgi:endoglucanase
LLAVALGCQGAEPYYRHASLGGSDGGPTSGDAAVPPDDASADRGTGGQTFFADSGGSEPAAGDGGSGDGSDGEAGCGSCALGVLYWCEGTTANTIRATFQLVNDTPQPIPLQEVTIRYWFTGIGAPWDFVCDLGLLEMMPKGKPITAEVTGVFHPVTPARPGADTYFEVGFTPTAGDLLPQQGNTIRTRAYRHDFNTITQTDDYSFTPKNTTFGPAPHITLYRNGMLIDGVEPQPR